MRAELIKALKSHAQGHIDKHIANVEVQLQKATGVAEHSDHIETVEKELKIIAQRPKDSSLNCRYAMKNLKYK